MVSKLHVVHLSLARDSYCSLLCEFARNFKMILKYKAAGEIILGGFDNMFSETDYKIFMGLYQKMISPIYILE